MPNITLRAPGQDAAPSWTKRVNYYQFVGERLSADGDSRRGIQPMSASAIAEALLTGHQIQWCINHKSVLAELEKTLGAPVEISRTHSEGVGSYASSSGFEYSFQASDLVLVAAPISDFCGQDLYLMTANRVDRNS